MIFANFGSSNHLAYKSQITNIVIYCAYTAKNIKKSFHASYHSSYGNDNLQYDATDCIGSE